MAASRSYKVQSRVALEPTMIDPWVVDFRRVGGAPEQKLSFFDFRKFARHSLAARAIAGAFYRYYLPYNQTETPYMGWMNLARLFKFFDCDVVAHGPISSSRRLDEACLARYGNWLQRRRGIGTRTRYIHYGIAKRLFAEIARKDGRRFTIGRGPFVRINDSSIPVPQLSSSEYTALLKAARREARLTWRQFERYESNQMSPSERELVAFFRKTYRGLAPPTSDDFFPGQSALFLLYKGLGGQRDYAARLHATPRSLIPFVILIADETLSNAEALRQFGRDCVTEAPIFASLRLISWDKGRSGRGQAIAGEANRYWSIPSLVDRVLRMTAPLVANAPRSLQNNLFLALTAKAGVTVPSLQTLGYALRAFIQDNDLKGDDGSEMRVTIESIRPTSMMQEYLKSGDLFAVHRRSGHMHLSTTAIYIMQQRSRDHHDGIIAVAQGKLSRRFREGAATVAAIKKGSAAGSESDAATERAVGVAFECRDPYRAPHLPVGTRCPEWLMGLSDPALVIPDEPIYVARLIQVRDRLLDAKNAVNPGRFDLLYAVPLRLIENEILPRFSDDRLREATALSRTLPALPDLSNE
jgi:hypothetical protein